MAQETVFRLIALRPGLKSIDDTDIRETPVYDRPDKRTELFDDVADATGAGKKYDEVVRVVRRHKATGSYLSSDAELSDDVKSLLNWFDAKRRKRLGQIDVADDISQIYGDSFADVVRSKAFKHGEAVLADTVFADAIDNGDLNPGGKQGIGIALKLLVFLQRYSEAPGAYDHEQRLGALIEMNTIVIPDVAAIQPKGGSTLKPVEEPVDDNRNKLDRLEKLDSTFRELTRLVRDDGNVVIEGECSGTDSASGLRDDVKRLRRKVDSITTQHDKDDKLSGRDGEGNSAAVDSELGSRDLRLSQAALGRISVASLEALGSVNVDATTSNPMSIVARLEEEMEIVGSTVISEFRRGGKLLMHGGSMDIGKFEKAVSPLKGNSRKSMAVTMDGDMHATIGRYTMPTLATCKQSVGVGDLLMVKQTIKAYEVGEFGHVENVLAGETREREHRRLNVREEISVLETEREVEEERDLQSTTRNEMQNEIQRTIKNEFGLEAGLQVSGSYGPSVSFTASMNTSFSSSMEESQRKATSFSREVTEKTAERVRERVREEQRRRVLEEVEEINRHKVENPNAGDGHVRGIYRWLNKIYDAQVLRYGQRMMFEFVVPEPAAFFLHALVDNAPDEMLIEKPEEPDYYGAPLKPSNLSRTNYHRYVSEYKVSGVRPPPTQYRTVSLQDGLDYSGSEVSLGRSGKFDIPDGYESYAVRVHHDHVFTEGDDRRYHIMIGGAAIDATPIWGSTYRNVARTRKELSIAYQLMSMRSFTLGADLYCELTTEGYEKWKLETYESIVQAYLDQKAAYDEQLRAREIQEGIRVLGRNPLENRRIERDELRKLVLRFITGGVGMGEDVFFPTDEPIVDVAKACPWGKYVQFFENAFEWQNLMYVLYPYFWGRHARWVNALHLTDPDPDFAAFLRAGAARVQVPVRPGFEKAIAYYCQTGRIWNGGDPPLLDDDLYVPIVQEIAENLGGMDEGEPYPEGSEPWEVTIPTSLVLIQDLEEIPQLRDVLTGDAVDILNAV